MPSCDGKADLVVELGRRRYIAFLLDMKSHASGTGLNAATIRTELPGDNCGFVLRACENFLPLERSGLLLMRCRSVALLGQVSRRKCVRFRFDSVSKMSYSRAPLSSFCPSFKEGLACFWQ